MRFGILAKKFHNRGRFRDVTLYLSILMVFFAHLLESNSIAVNTDPVVNNLNIPCIMALRGSVGAALAGYRELLAIGVDRNSFNKLPKGVAANPPEAPDAITFVSYPDVPGTPVTKITVKNDRRYTQPYGEARGPKDPIRAEFSTIDAPMTGYQEGDDRAYHLGLMLDDSWKADRRESPDIFTQFKRTNGQPDMFLAIKGKDMVLRIGRDQQIDVLKDVKVGQWIDILIKVRWSSGSAGRVDLAYRYAGAEDKFEQWVSYAGPNMDSRSGKTYVKFGIYKPAGFSAKPNPQEHILYFSNFALFAKPPK